MKVKTNFVPNESKYYLTEDKEYEVYFKFKGKRSIIITDIDEEAVIMIDDAGCAHLDYYCWDVVDD